MEARELIEKLVKALEGVMDLVPDKDYTSVEVGNAEGIVNEAWGYLEETKST